MRLVVSVNPDVAASIEREQVDRTVAENLIADMQIPTLGVMNLRGVHSHPA
jgi:hypothetical protein